MLVNLQANLKHSWELKALVSGAMAAGSCVDWWACCYKTLTDRYDLLNYTVCN